MIWLEISLTLTKPIIAETDGLGNLIKAYVWLHGQPLAQIVAGGGVYYYHNDHLGTPQKMTDGAGSVVWAADYLPFGQADVIVANVENNLRFKGQYYDKETGLHYNYHRYYDPQLGRYLRADPIGLDGGMNLFTFVSNNPINKIDPLGLKECYACDECPCGSWSGKGHNYGGFIAVIGVFTTHVNMECNCSEASVKLSFTSINYGAGLGASWEKFLWYRVWGACNAGDLKSNDFLSAGGSGGKFGLGGTYSGSGGFGSGSSSGSGGIGLGGWGSIGSNTFHH